MCEYANRRARMDNMNIEASENVGELLEFNTLQSEITTAPQT